MKRDQYIPHDASARNNGKLMYLLQKEGPAGYGIYWILLENLRTQEDYKISMNLVTEVARQMHTSPAKVKKVMTDYELFVVENGYLYSPDLNEKMQPLEQKRKQYEEYKHQKEGANLLKDSSGNDTVKNTIEPQTVKVQLKQIATTTEEDGSPVEKAEAAEAGIGSETKAGIKAGTETSAGTSERTSAGAEASAGTSEETSAETRTSAETSAAAAEVELVLHPGAALWEKWVDELDCEAQWKELVAKRSGMMMDFFPLFPRLLECFKNHVRSIGNEDKIRCLNDAKRYFSFYLSPGSITRKRLAEELKAGSRSRDRDNPFRYEERDPATGSRSYCGFPIPADAPPRPTERAQWNPEGGWQ